MNWEYVRLGDVCSKIGSGATPKGGAKVYIDDGTSLIRSQNVYNLEFSYGGLAHITENAAKKLNGVTVKKNDVLINITGDSVARTCIVPDNVLPARVNQHVAIVRPNSDVLNPSFLNYYLASPYMQSFMLGLAIGKGASRNAMTKDMIANFKVLCPPLDIQKLIVNKLSVYDNLIENNKKQIKLLEEAAQRLYKEWFVDLRFPGHKTTPIVDGLPEEWEKNCANHFFDITIGKTPPRAEKQWFTKSEGVPWSSISDMGNSGIFVFNTTECLTEEAVSKHNVKKIPNGTVILSFKLTVGRVSITATEMCTNEAIAHFYVNDDTRYYTYLYLKMFPYDELGNTSSISKAINSKIVKSMPFIVPSTRVLNDFNKTVVPIFSQICCLQKQIRHLTEARDRLLPKLMNGEILV